MLSNERIAKFFSETKARIEGNPSLREPQLEGHAAAVKFFEEGGHRAVEQIPVGCGKTGLISILPFGIAEGRVLIVTPNLTIRDQIAAAVDTTDPNSFYRRAGVLVSHFGSGPHRAMLDSGANIHDADEAHIVVTNIQQLTEHNDRWLPKFGGDYFKFVIVDEGHHNAATTWQNVFERFPKARVVSLTATPFRSDEQPVEGEIIYRYNFRRAMQRGYIKHMTARNVAPRELRFTIGDEEHTHTLEEVLEMRTEHWYSRGVALAEESNVSIVDASIQHLEYLREGTGLEHQLIAAACSMDHARQVRDLYEERGVIAQEIHSGQSIRTREEVLRNLRNGTLHAIIQVQMLGEGFDHPELSVAAIFRPFRSLSPYIQFIGRAMRANVQRAPGHPDNEGIIVSHVGLNIDRHWGDFKYIDRDDQLLVREWLGAEDEPPPEPEEEKEEMGGGGQRPLPRRMVVTQEFVDQFLSDSYLDADDDTLIDNAVHVARQQGLDLEALGITREELHERLKQARGRLVPQAPERMEVQPQVRRQILRDRLRAQAQAAAGRVLESLGERPNGRRIAALGGSGGGAHNNLGAVMQMMHSNVNSHIGIESSKRRDQDIDALERGLDALEYISRQVEDELREKLDARQG